MVKRDFTSQSIKRVDCHVPVCWDDLLWSSEKELIYLNLKPLYRELITRERGIWNGIDGISTDIYSPASVVWPMI